MKVSLFSPILILLILTLFAKASILFGRIQEQTSYHSDTHTTSMIIDTAYAKTEVAETKEHGSGNSNEHSDKKKDESDNKKGDKKEVEDVKTSTIDRDSQPKNNENSLINNLSKSEIELLKELSKRRDKLDNDKKNIDMREQVLKATENKLDQKVTELKQLQTQLEALMKQYDEKEKGKILSLVKIYETMKAKDAAKIFNELEMPVLIKVVSNMKEVKVAPIIASMDPAKARDLSMELAKQKPLE